MPVPPSDVEPRDRSEERDFPVHDDAKVVERPGLVVVLDVRAEEAELEAGDPKRPLDVQEIELVAIVHARLLALRLDVESLCEEKRGPQPGNVEERADGIVPDVREAHLPPLLVCELE